jgi:hypothetical protein
LVLKSNGPGEVEEELEKLYHNYPIVCNYYRERYTYIIVGSKDLEKMG